MANYVDKIMLYPDIVGVKCEYYPCLKPNCEVSRIRPSAKNVYFPDKPYTINDIAFLSNINTLCVYNPKK